MSQREREAWDDDEEDDVDGDGCPRRPFSSFGPKLLALVSLAHSCIAGPDSGSDARVSLHFSFFLPPSLLCSLSLCRLHCAWENEWRQ